MFLIIKNTFQVEIWPSSRVNDSETLETGLIGVKNPTTFLEEPRTPLEACTFGTHFGDQSVFILDPHLLARHTIIPTSRNMLQ